MQIKVKKLHPDAFLPIYATMGAACFDVFALHPQNDDSVDTFVFNTGLSFEIPEGYVMLIFSRSGHGFRDNIRLANCVGVIDSDYRGELKIKLTADGDAAIIDFEHGARIAQGMIIPIPAFGFVEVEELNNTIRGTGGFGSTGN
jgi:dUTP pyrophosphatase